MKLLFKITCVYSSTKFKIASNIYAQTVSRTMLGTYMSICNSTTCCEIPSPDVATIRPWRRERAPELPK